MKAGVDRKRTLRRFGGSIGVTIPKDMAERLHLGAGLAVAAQVAKRFRNALRELAK